jgi:PRC-barrel domain
MVTQRCERDVAMAWSACNELADWVDRRAVDRHGQSIVVIVDIYTDAPTGRPAWLAISSGFFGTRVVVAPVGSASLLGEDVVVAHARDVIERAPHVEAIVTIPPGQERSVIDHYGVGCSAPRPNPSERQP